MGNRKQKTDTLNGATVTENSTFDAANSILTRGTQAYVSDLNGNTLSDGQRVMTWDSQNRMTHCLKAAAGANPAIATDFYYGTDGLRRQKIATTAGNATPVVTNSVLDSGMLLRETNGSGQSVATYLVGARGPECKRDDARGGLARWYVFDGMGSVVGEVDPNGNVTTARNLDVYGAARGTTYTAAGEKPSKQAFVGSLGHTSDDETGLVYMRARYMDTNTGRFVSEDPKGSGNNWFTYCNNNPVNYVDEDGKAPETKDVLVGVFFAAVVFSIANDLCDHYIENFLLKIIVKSGVTGVGAVIGTLVGMIGLRQCLTNTLSVLKDVGKLAAYGVGAAAIVAITGYAGMLMGEMIVDGLESIGNAGDKFSGNDPSESNGPLPL